MEQNTNQITNEYEIRLEKLKNLKKEEVAYKERFERSHTIKEARGLDVGTNVKLCGRITGRRGFGKLIFCDLFDIDAKIQIELTLNELGERLEFVKKYMDVADFVGVEGELFYTKVGELTVRVKKFELLSKSLRPLAEKFHGIVDTDTRYRQRYLDVISNEETRYVLTTRFKIVKSIRDFMYKHEFLEVETPILQGVATGAAAKPFITHHNALDKDFYLRIAPEIALKEMIAAGFDRVFEIGKNFRNEGMDPSHLQEFTVIEWYAAYWNYEDNINFVVDLFQSLVKEFKGDLILEYQGKKLDFSNIKRINYIAQLSEILGESILSFKTAKEMHKAILNKKLVNAKELEKATSLSATIDLLFKRTLRPNLIQPVIVYNYPACLVPLARRNDKNENIIDMFQFVVNGWEMLKAYSELVDPVVQREAFEEQSKNRKQGDDEAFEPDEDFLLCMEHGMPPISGLGIGIDRLITLLTNQETVRDVVFFPLVK